MAVTRGAGWATRPRVMQGSRGVVRQAAYLVGVPLLCEDVPDESLLHLLLLHQKLPQTLDGQRRAVARPGASTTRTTTTTGAH